MFQEAWKQSKHFISGSLFGLMLTGCVTQFQNCYPAWYCGPVYLFGPVVPGKPQGLILQPKQKEAFPRSLFLLIHILVWLGYRQIGCLENWLNLHIFFRIVGINL